MGRFRTANHRPGRWTAVLVTTAVTLGVSLFGSVPATAATAPHAPVGEFVRSSDVTRPQFCSDGQPVSSSPTPIFGVSSGAPAYNQNRPDLKAQFEVAPAGRAPLVSVTVAFDASLAIYQVPPGVLSDGEYRVRVRAVDRGKTSTWVPWCAFTVETTNIPVPETPINLRVSAYPYDGFQTCDGSTAPVVDDAFGPTFGGTPPSYDFTPNLVGRFEVARPGVESRFGVGSLYGTVVPWDGIVPGDYQFRVRAEEGNAVSDWSPWCGLTVA